MEQEGGDITAEDMCSVTEPSQIQQYFCGSTVFITGGTGFLGRLLVEKLLRSCSDLEKIYILVRPKDGKSVKQRFEEYFDDCVYDRLKREKPRSMSKLSLIVGDCTLSGLGIDEENKRVLIEKVNYIFHAAATVRFDVSLKIAANTNVKGTKNMLKFAKEMKNLQSFVYVSTAYSFCPRRTIDEEFYEPTITTDGLLALADNLNEDILNKIAPTLITGWPNVYSYSKSIAEDCIISEGSGLPLAVVRPSIVFTTSKEPIAGWTNSLYGPAGLFVAGGLGVLHTAHCDGDCHADIIPADYTINTIIAAAWRVASTKSYDVNDELNEDNTKITIYNCVSSPRNPITWAKLIETAFTNIAQIPMPVQLWHHFFYLVPNKFIYLVLHYVFHIIPGHIADYLATRTGQKPRLVKIYSKLEKSLDVFNYFMMRQWVFRNCNTQKLWECLNEEDRKIFEFDIKSLDWDVYIYTFVRGLRVYIVKDPLDSVPEGQKKQLKLKVMHYAVVAVIMLIVLLFGWIVLF